MNMSAARIRIISRFYHTTPICRGAKLNKLPKVMNKFIKSGVGKRKWNGEDKAKPALPSAAAVADTQHEHSRTANRRTAVLNKLFIRHISDQMCTGEIAEMLEGEDVQITKLKITNDFYILNIYWTTGDILRVDIIDDILKKISGILRHELSQLKLIGNVPKIFFIRDKGQLMISELDSVLSNADFGEDYKPIHYTKLKSDFISSAPLKPNILEKVKELEETEDIEEMQIPEMSQNIFGLDRERIINNITASKNKSAEAWKKHSEKRNFENEDSHIKEDYDFAQRTNHSKIDFHNFLRQRKVMQKKLREAMKADDNITVNDQNDENDEAYEENDKFDDSFYIDECENDVKKEEEKKY